MSRARQRSMSLRLLELLGLMAGNRAVVKICDDSKSK